MVIERFTNAVSASCNWMFSTPSTENTASTTENSVSHIVTNPPKKTAAKKVGRQRVINKSQRTKKRQRAALQSKQSYNKWMGILFLGMIGGAYAGEVSQQTRNTITFSQPQISSGSQSNNAPSTITHQTPPVVNNAISIQPSSPATSSSIINEIAIASAYHVSQPLNKDLKFNNFELIHSPEDIDESWLREVDEAMNNGLEKFDTGVSKSSLAVNKGERLAILKNGKLKDEKCEARVSVENANIAEITAHLLNVPGTNVPETHIIRYNDIEYSMQRWASNTSQVTKDTLKNVSNIQGIAALDLILRNLDRHGGNLLIDDKNEGIAIDHSLSLNEITCKRTAALDKFRGRQAIWYDLPKAKELFSSELRNWIKQLDTEEVSQMLTTLGLNEKSVRATMASIELIKKSAELGLSIDKITDTIFDKHQDCAFHKAENRAFHRAQTEVNKDGNTFSFEEIYLENLISEVEKLLVPEGPTLEAQITGAILGLILLNCGLVKAWEGFLNHQKTHHQIDTKNSLGPISTALNLDLALINQIIKSLSNMGKL